MFYKIADIRYSDVTGNTLSLGNIPIRVENERIILADPNPHVRRTDPEGCDTPNFSRRTCDDHFLLKFRTLNERTRKQADLFLEVHLGPERSAVFMSSEDLRAQSIAAFFGLFNNSEISAAALPIRPRLRNSNPRIDTDGDPDFRRGSGSYRRFRRNDTHPKLLDSSWVGPAHRSSKEIAR